MPTYEKELNMYLLERYHSIKRIKKAAMKEGATIQDVLEVIESEEADVNEMLYQKSPLTSDY